MDHPDLRCILPVSGEELLFKNISTAQQKSILKAYEKEDFILLEYVFDVVLTECCLTPNFNVLDMYSYDRQYVLIQLRIESVTEEFMINPTCPICEEEKDIAMDISEIDYNMLLVPQSSIRIDISHGLAVTINLPTRQSEIDLSTFARKISGSRKLLIGDDEVLSTDFFQAYCAARIESVIFTDPSNAEIVEVPSFEDRISFLSSLSPTDYDKIKIAIEDLYTVSNIIFTVQCNPCEYEIIEEYPWNEFFYRTMIGHINFQGIFQEIGTLCFSEQINFNKTDIENMPPFERQGYIDYFSGLMKEQQKQMEEENKNKPSHP